jgi:transposase
MFLRRVGAKKGEPGRHWALVESSRTSRGPRQRVVAYIGDVEEELRLGVKHAADSQPGQSELFAPKQPEWVEVDARRVYVERARSFGAHWLALEVIKQLGLDSFLAGRLEDGRAEIPWSSVAQILAIQRLIEPSSELFIAETSYEKSALSDLLGVPAGKVNDDRLYRALDKLLPEKEALEKHLKSRAGELFALEYDLLLYDITSTFFEGQAARNSQARRGYSRDHRGDCSQVTIALVVSREGFPLGYEVFDGNRADVTTVEDIVESIEERYGKSGRVWVMDRGMTSEDNVEFLSEGERKYILGATKGSLKVFEQQLLEGDWTQVQEGVEVKLCPSENGMETFVLCRSSSRKDKERAMLARFEKRIDDGLGKIASSCARKRHSVATVERRVGRLLGQNTRAEKLFDVRVQANAEGGAEMEWSKRESMREWLKLSHGCYMLRTNISDWPAQELWRAYIQLTQAESAFRICKSELGLRPVWHQKTERVQAHILVCFLGYVLWKTLGLMCKQAGIGDSPRKLLDELAAVQMVDVVLPTRSGIEIRKRCVSIPEPHLAALLARLNLELPRNLDIQKV